MGKGRKATAGEKRTPGGTRGSGKSADAVGSGRTKSLLEGHLLFVLDSSPIRHGHRRSSVHCIGARGTNLINIFSSKEVIWERTLEPGKGCPRAVGTGLKTVPPNHSGNMAVAIHGFPLRRPEGIGRYGLNQRAARKAPVFKPFRWPSSSTRAARSGSSSLQKWIAVRMAPSAGPRASKSSGERKKALENRG